MPYYAVFEGTVYTDKQETSYKFYETLNPHLRKQPGLVEEINYLNDKPNDSMLLSSWINEEALVGWQVLPIHLRIQKAGRESVFSSYRIRTGYESDSTTCRMTSKTGSFMVLFQHPKDSALQPENLHGSLPSGMKHLLREDCKHNEVFQGLLDHSIWLTETHILQVSGWPNLEVAERFGHSLKRVPGDWLRRIAVHRDYKKTDREEAPAKTEPDCMER